MMTKIAAVIPFLFLLAPRPVNVQPAAGIHRPDPSELTLTLKTKSGGGVVTEKQEVWAADNTAIIVCDMWDRHWCAGATRRVAELAPRLNDVLTMARSKGVLIVHAPSDCMTYYKDYPQRLRAARFAAVPVGFPDGESRLLSEKAGIWPIDQSNEGCNDTPRCVVRNAWKKETDLIRIDSSDVISDSGPELDALFKQAGISKVILVGVHTNMCIIARSFGLRNMSRLGKETVLMRDMTDAMYDSRASPFVNHFTGVRLMIGYIETYIAPSIVSSDITGQPAFHFSEDKDL